MQDKKSAKIYLILSRAGPTAHWLCRERNNWEKQYKGPLAPVWVSCRPAQEKETTKKMGPKRMGARQVWARTEPTVDLSKQLTTWLLPFIFTLPNQTQYVAKAGNKAYGLSSNFPNTVGNGYGPTFGSTELALKRKYRYKRCPFRVITLYIFYYLHIFCKPFFLYFL